ncbi:AAA family ATPase [Hymenobacter sp. H14-R3]|uniref:AAA family ATPase n=1 Tax=Hymenobacter sp. H14-R3 TaxID=3046308 RepID=UPI0024BB488D|nr:AAA family ATPase [Hymenobacter sp. H14-R3]MDJ0364146.1 AAA family ATPase [Hymenobacter sp. H14-R3]
MKIISLRFANLNSLPGPYLIRFDAAPLADTGLFAITGPTGAGKSTLLDAIAVGLYGRVPRHDRQVGEMVSRHAAGAWSEVEFEVHETNPDTGLTARVRYRSRWEVKRKTRGDDKGGLGQDAMTLVLSPSGEAVVSGKEAVPAKVGELSGLDFGQFEQAVLLSQGKFARFLHAPEKERSALLEKMTNVGIYSRLSVAAFEKAKEEEQKTKLLEATLHATRLLPDEERQRLEHLLDELDREAQGIYDHQQELGAFLAWRTILDQLDRQLADATRQATQLGADDAALQPPFARLADHERAATPALSNALVLSKQAQQELSRDAEALAQLERQLPQLHTAAEAAKVAHALAATSQTTALAEAERLYPVLQEAQSQDTTIRAAQNQLAKSRAAHDHAAAAHADEQAAWNHTQASGLAQLQQQQATLHEWLAAHHHERDLTSELTEINSQLLDLELVNTQLATLQAQQKSQLKLLADATADQQRHAQAAGEALQKQRALVEQGRPYREEVTTLLRGTDAAALAQDAADLTARLSLLQRLLPQAQAAHDHTARAQALVQEHAQAAPGLTTAETTFDHLEQRRADGQRLLDSYQRELRAQQALADLNAHRQHLRPGQPCPLCGAAEHVFAADFEAEADEQEQRVTTQKTALTQMNEALTTAGQELARLRYAQQQRLARHDEATATATLARTQATELAALLTPAPPDPADPAAVGDLLAATTAQQASTDLARRRLATLTEELAQLKAEHTAAGARLTQAQDEGLLAADRRQQAHLALQPLDAELVDTREQAANYRAVIQSLLTPHQLLLPATSQRYAGVLATLHERADCYHARNLALDKSQSDLAALQKEQAVRADNLAKTAARLQADADSLRIEQQAIDAQRATRMAAYAGPDPATEQERLHQATRQLAKAFLTTHDEQARQQQALDSTREKLGQRQDDLQRHEATYQGHQADLHAALAAAGFASAAEAQALLLPETEARQLAQRRQRHLTDQQASQQLQAKLAADLAHHHEAALTALPTAALTAELAQLNAENEKLHQRLGAAASQLTHDDEARQQQAEGLRQLAARQREQQRWQDLAEQIGSAKGDKFSQFAQGLTLSHLARLANLRLQQLTGRYTILKTPNRNLELQIIDHDQADTVRPMASLSGGESFLVSLALALGLSELAGYKARIESLFIDEGFGTLDPDSLNTALDALERLQHSGKMIGIISHVADLKERIGTQIRVQPGAGGNSTVRVVDVVGTETSCEA